jgi:RNA polymerase sigma-70 factor (ECF subfamily)
MRRRKVRPQFEREVREGDLDAPSVLEEIQSRDRVAGIAQAILQLPAEERQVVQLRLQEELGFREIAELLEVPLGTVLSRMHQARDRLRRALKSEIQSTPVI